MIKTAAPHSKVAITNGESKTKLNPKSQFIGAVLSMSWQLAIIVLVLVVGGDKIDQHFKTLPVFTILGFVLAMTGTVLVIKKTLSKFINDGNYKDKS
jgi:hypothetical protein